MNDSCFSYNYHIAKWKGECIVKKIIVLLLVLSICISFAGCSAGEPEARQVLETYTQNLADNDYESAYNLITDFDRENISKELFIQWQTAVSKVLKIESFSIEKKVDRFNNYEYKGAKFKKAFGYKVKRTDKILIPGVEMTGYDSEDYRIMVANDNGSMKVALLLTDLEETVKKYTRQLEIK
jgi:hypothetical protein